MGVISCCSSASLLRGRAAAACCDGRQAARAGCRLLMSLVAAAEAPCRRPLLMLKTSSLLRPGLMGAERGGGRRGQPKRC